MDIWSGITKYTRDHVLHTSFRAENMDLLAHALPIDAYRLCCGIVGPDDDDLPELDPVDSEMLRSALCAELPLLIAAIDETMEVLGHVLSPMGFVPSKFAKHSEEGKARGDAKMVQIQKELDAMYIETPGTHRSPVQRDIHNVLLRNLGPLVYGVDVWDKIVAQLVIENEWPYRPPQFALVFGWRRLGKSVAAAMLIAALLICGVAKTQVICGNGQRSAQALLALTSGFIRQRLTVQQGANGFEIRSVGGAGESIEVYLKKNGVSDPLPLGKISAYPQSVYVTTPIPNFDVMSREYCQTKRGGAAGLQIKVRATSLCSCGGVGDLCERRWRSLRLWCVLCLHVLVVVLDFLRDCALCKTNKCCYRRIGLL